MTSLDPLMSSKSVEWYTPTRIVERVILVLGEIDLDPCSNSRTAPNVPAAHHFTQEDNGLALPWRGRIYMNPPYGRATIGKWIKKLLTEWQAGRVTQALVLLASRTDTQWMAQLREFPRCYILGRLRFSGHKNGAPFPSVVVSLGCDLQTFTAAFKDIGDVYQLVPPPSLPASEWEQLQRPP